MEYFENDPIRDLAYAINYASGVRRAARLGNTHIEVMMDDGRTLLLDVVESY